MVAEDNSFRGALSGVNLNPPSRTSSNEDLENLKFGGIQKSSESMFLQGSKKFLLEEEKEDMDDYE